MDTRAPIPSLTLAFLLSTIQWGSASTISTFDVLVATDTLVVSGSATVVGRLGISTSSAESLFAVGSASFTITQAGFVGIGTATPKAQLHLVGKGILSDGVQFYWNAASGSFRAGESPANAWTPTLNAPFSYVFGAENDARGAYSSVTGGYSNINASSYSIIAGGYFNSISSGVNSTGFYTAIAGGAFNESRFFARTGFIGGGVNNSIEAEGASIASGSNNKSKGQCSFVGGGLSNTADGVGAFIGGGSQNFLQSCSYCTISGGAGNTITGTPTGGTIAGGGVSPALLNVGNVIGGISASVLGGAANTASGDFSAVLGGYSNTASGQYATALGLKSTASNRGAFVWADSQNIPLNSAVNDEFRLRAGGGYVFLSSATSPTVIVSSGPLLISTATAANGAVPHIYLSSGNGYVGIGTRAPETTIDINGNAQFGATALKSTFTATPGATQFALQLSTGVKLFNGGVIELTGSGHIRWADGSISTTASSGSGSSGVAVSSTGIIPGLSTTNTTSGVCVANSTRTITGTATKVLVVFAGNTYNTNGSDSFDLGVLRDGVKLGPGRSIGHNTAKAAPYYYDDDSFSFIDDNVPSGTKSYCFWLATTGNTGHLCNSGSGPCHFGVIEIH